MAAHCLTDDGARRAIEGGVASIEHGHLMTDETLWLAKRNNTVLVGTDLSKQAGYSNAEILQMMTINAARLLGVEDERGAIKPGQAADIIATVANPLDDINALQKVSFVMKEGKVFRQE